MALGDRGPDVDRALRRGDLDADLAERRDDQVAAAGVGRVLLGERLGRACQRGDAGQLQRLVEARVDVGLQPPVGLDRVGVAEDRGDPPAGHVVALGEREDLHPDLLGAGRGEEAGRDVAVVGRLRVSVVVDDEDLVLAGKGDDFLEEPVGDDRPGRVVRVVDEHHLRLLERGGRDRREVGREAPLRQQRQQLGGRPVEQRPAGVDRVAGVGGERDVARVEEGVAEVVDALLGADRRDHLARRVDLDPEAPVVEAGEGLAELVAARFEGYWWVAGSATAPCIASTMYG